MYYILASVSVTYSFSLVFIKPSSEDVLANLDCDLLFLFFLPFVARQQNWNLIACLLDML